jgi:hypothetical protein
MEFDLIQLIESGKKELVASSVEIILNQNRQGLDEIALRGRALIPANEEAQFLVLAAEYHRHAEASKKPGEKLWQYALALAASKKSNNKRTNHTCWEAIQKGFPELPIKTRDYLEEYKLPE